MSQGYNAGSIYVDLIIEGTNATKTLDEYAKRIQQLEKKERTYLIQKKALEETLRQEKLAYGENSKQVQAIEKKIASLVNKEKLLKNEIVVVSQAMKNQAKVINEQNKSFKSHLQHIGNLTDSFKQMALNAMTPTEGIAKLSNSLNILKAAILGVAAHKLYDALILPSSEMENTIASLEVLLGSYEKAQTLTESLINLASVTPLETADLTAGAKSLIAVGVELEDINSTLQMLGDLAMGDSEKLGRLINAFGKIQTSGRGTLEYLNYFTEAGVPIIAALADTIGITTEEFYKLSKAGGVSAQQVTTALRSLTSEGGKFYGMMEKQSKTYKGMISTLQDSITIIGQDIGTEVLEELKVYIGDIIDEIERLENTGELDKIVKQWGGAFADLVSIIGEAISFLYKFKDIIIAMIAGFAGYKVITLAATAISSLVSVLGTAAVPVAALSAGLGLIFTKELELRSATKLLAEEYKELADANKEANDSYNDKWKGLKDRQKTTKSLIGDIRELIYTESLEASEKERLLSAISDLNEMYPNLNLRYDEQSERINRNINEVEQYIELIEKQNALNYNSEYGSGLGTRIEDTAAAMQELIDRNRILETELNKIPESVANYWKRRRIADQISYNAKLILEYRDSLKIMTAQYEEYMSTAAEVSAEQNRLASTTEAMVDSWAHSSKTLSDVRNDYQALVDSLAEARNEFEGIFDDMIGELDNLTDILGQEGDSLKLTEKQARDLARTYPELAEKIKVTSDAYLIERNVIEELKVAKAEEAKLAVENQKTATEEAIRATKERISAYNLEVSAITSLAEAQKALMKSRNNYNQWENKMSQSKENAMENAADLSGITTTTGIGEMLDQDIKDSEKLVELFKQLEDSKSSIAGYEKEIEIILANIDKISSGGTEKADELAIRNLKYSLDMEYITQEQYYNELERLRDKYYKAGTKQWQQYTLEITKGRKKMEEDNANAELQAYEDRLSASYGWIDTESFYGRLDGKELIEAYKRMQAYTKEYYENEKISYERYVEEMKKLDKEIYSVMKDNLATSNNELSDLRKKRYDEAVKQVENYYDELERAEEEAERKKQLSELQGQLDLYQGAVTRAGQEKYNEILEDIEDIKKEGEKAAREVEKQSKLDELESTYKTLEKTQEEYFSSILTYSEDVTKKIQEMTSLVNSAFSNVTNILSGVAGGVENSNSYQTIINQNNNINSEAAGRAVVNMTDVLYRYNI